MTAKVLLCLLTISVASSLFQTVEASTIHYTLSGVNDGADTYAGSFDYDIVSAAYTNVNIVASGPSITGGTEAFSTGLLGGNGQPISGYNELALGGPNNKIQLGFSTGLGAYAGPDYILQLVIFNYNSPISLPGSGLCTPPACGYVITDAFIPTPTDAPAPGPIAGAGLPGLMFACGGIFAWWRRKRSAILTSVAA